MAQRIAVGLSILAMIALIMMAGAIAISVASGHFAARLEKDGERTAAASEALDAGLIEARLSMIEAEMAAIRQEMKGGGSEGIEARLVALEGDVAILRAASGGARAGLAGYVSLGFFLKEFAAAPIGGKVGVGDLLGVYGGRIVVCAREMNSGLLESRIIGSMSNKRYLILNTERLLDNGERGGADWHFWPARFGEAAYCERVR